MPVLRRLGIVVWMKLNDQFSVSEGGAEGIDRRIFTFRIKIRTARPKTELKGK